MVKERRLGKGLEALIGSATESPTFQETPQPGTHEIDIALLKPNRYQPRTSFDDAGIQELAKSLDTDGFLQPILVRSQGEFFEIIAGERRWRAAQLKGLKKVPVIIKDVDDRKALELALVENIHRKDLNPIEKARAFRELLKQLGTTQEEVADRIGVDRSTIANLLRLLDLSIEVQDAVSRGTITMGHARALAAVPNSGVQIALLNRIIKEDLSVRSIERIVSVHLRTHKKRFDRPERDPYFKALEDSITAHLGTKVTVQPKGKGGTITIEYYSNEQFTGIIQKLGVTAS